MATDRREHHRHRTWRVEVNVASPEDFRASYLRDISAGGLFVRSSKPLPVGARVMVELSVSGQQLRLPGAVVRVEAGGFGVKFDALSEAQRAGVEALTASVSEPLSTEAELAEARGVIEAYEMSLASMREGEATALQRAELAEFERGVVQQRLGVLEHQLDGLTRENAALRARISAAEAQLGSLETARLDARAKERHALTRAKGDAERAAMLEAQLAARERELDATRDAFERKLVALRELPVGPELERLRQELKNLASELDDERLKSMALERALLRFRAMGGVVP